jgi:PhzF family phenazine biosynthesis protein
LIGEVAKMPSSVSPVETVVVFPDGPGGGNPAPIVLDARGWSDPAMQQVACDSGHESAFAVDAAGTECDLALRFWVPNHEMSMCGHATVGAVWLMNQRGMLPAPASPVADRELRVHTASGVVRVRIDAAGSVSVSQPPAVTKPVTSDQAVLDTLNLDRAQLAGPVRNATTSRAKTLVPLADPSRLDSLSPAWERVEQTCAVIGTTGLYPYAPSGPRQFDARQFPRSSGYPEDPATGVAAAALAGALVSDGTVPADGGAVVIRQGRAMGRPSRIVLTFDTTNEGAVATCWLGGTVQISR